MFLVESFPETLNLGRISLSLGRMEECVIADQVFSFFINVQTGVTFLLYSMRCGIKQFYCCTTLAEEEGY